MGSVRCLSSRMIRTPSLPLRSVTENCNRWKEIGKESRLRISSRSPLTKRLNSTRTVTWVGIFSGVGTWRGPHVNALQRATAQIAYGKLPNSTYEEAAQCFEKAIELNPNRLMHYIELGCVYAHMGRTEDARNLISKGLAMQDTEKDDPETKRHGQEVLANLQ